MRVLRAHVVGLIRGHVGRAHAFTVAAPAHAAILGHPNATARDAEANDVRIAGIDNDGMYAGIIGAAADPAFAIRMVPEALDKRPVLAVIGMKQATRDRPTPKLIGASGPTRLERPYGLDVPWNRLVTHGVEILDVVGLLGIFWRRAFLPSLTAIVRALELDAKVTVLDRNEQTAIGLRQHERNRLPKQRCVLDGPASVPAIDDKQSLARSDDQSSARHRYPPDRS